MISIDGSQGEGGGQILRSSLALSAITGRQVQIERIRARRPKPGLQRQHVAAVLAAAQVCGGHIEGAELNSQEIIFTPGQPRSGTFSFDIGSAGSTTLVLQTILPILLHADASSTVTIRGGTHNSMSPPVEFLQDSFLPVLRRIGVNTTLDVIRHGFYPAGGGSIQATIHPWRTRTALDLCERGKAHSHRTEILFANLPSHVAEREALEMKQRLCWNHDAVCTRKVPAHGPGNVIITRLCHEHITTVFTAFGETRKPAEQVAGETAEHIKHHLATDIPVCEHLADQLLLPLALGAGGTFRTQKPSEHTLTNATILRTFLGDVVHIMPDGEGVRIGVRGIAHPAHDNATICASVADAIS